MCRRTVGLILTLAIGLLIAPLAAAPHATTTIPVVMVTRTAPVLRGLVTSRTRPGGTVTGVTLQSWCAGGRTMGWRGAPLAEGHARHVAPSNRRQRADHRRAYRSRHDAPSRDSRGEGQPARRPQSPRGLRGGVAGVSSGLLSSRDQSPDHAQTVLM
jgi:hypothetical protein